MWIDVKTLAEIVGKSRRTIQLQIKKNSSIVTRLKDNKSYEILVTSLPSEWQTLVVKKTSTSNVPVSALSTPAQLVIIEKKAVRIGSKIDDITQQELKQILGSGSVDVTLSLE